MWNFLNAGLMAKILLQGGGKDCISRRLQLMKNLKKYLRDLGSNGTELSATLVRSKSIHRHL